MLDDKPKDYSNLTAWFHHFRFTKHLPGMPMKLRAAMKEAPDNNAARFVMTAYAAAALDVAFFIRLGNVPATFAQELELTTGLKTGWLQSLSVDEIAKPMKVTAAELAAKLREGGFKIDADGIIGGYEQPSPSSPPAAQPAKPRDFGIL